MIKIDAAVGAGHLFATVDQYSDDELGKGCVVGVPRHVVWALDS
jgi:hypothetical protein